MAGMRVRTRRGRLPQDRDTGAARRAQLRYFAKPSHSRSARRRAAFADSLLASAPVVSQPHPERKSVLVEANALLLADIPGSRVCPRADLPPVVRVRRAQLVARQVRGTPDVVTFAVTAHYALGADLAAVRDTLPRVAASRRPCRRRCRTSAASFSASITTSPGCRPSRCGPASPTSASGTSGPTVSISRRTRRACRSSVTVDRWRLEKKDPASALSEPRQPIVFWLERNIPERYRPAIREAGILEWNKAFERIGYKDAIRVEVQPDDAEWDAGDVHRASVRWMTTARPSFAAIGPSTVDPRTGEILDADIGFDANAVRSIRHLRVERIATAGIARAGASEGSRVCEYADGAAQEVGFALDLLEARGAIAPDSAGRRRVRQSRTSRT